MNKTRIQLKLIWLLLAAVTLVALWQLNQQRQLATDVIAPQLPIITLGGEEIRLGAPNQPVRLLFFWSTSCAICLEELPEWVQLHEKFHHTGLEIVAVSMPYDPPAHLLRVKQDFALPYAIGLDMSGALKKAFGVLGTPTTVLVSKNNRLLYRQLGRTDFTALDKQIERALNQRSKETG